MPLARPMHVLSELLRCHDIPARPVDSWLLTKQGAPAWSCSLHRPEDIHGSLAQLDVDLALPDQRMVTESFSGFGDTLEEQLENAFDKFTRGTLHPLLSAFHGHKRDDQVDFETWKQGGRDWRVHVGPIVTYGVSGSPPQAPGDEIMEAVRRAFEAETLPTRTHWVRLFRGQVDDHPPTVEALLDNVPWPAGLAAWRGAPWPMSSGYNSARLFMVIAPPADATPTPYLSEAESVHVGLRRLLDLAAEEPEASDGLFYQALTSVSVAPSVADRLIAFVPMAFGEVMHPEPTYSSEYQLMEGSRPGPLRRLLDEPTYAAAKELAPTLKDDPGAMAGFRALALRSAAAAAMNDMVARGSRAEGLIFTRALVGLGRFSVEWPREAPTKPWWKFW